MTSRRNILGDVSNHLSIASIAAPSVRISANTICQPNKITLISTLMIIFCSSNKEMSVQFLLVVPTSSFKSNLSWLYCRWMRKQRKTWMQKTLGIHPWCLSMSRTFSFIFARSRYPVGHTYIDQQPYSCIAPLSVQRQMRAFASRINRIYTTHKYTHAVCVFIIRVFYICCVGQEHARSRLHFSSRGNHVENEVRVDRLARGNKFQNEAIAGDSLLGCPSDGQVFKYTSGFACKISASGNICNPDSRQIWRNNVPCRVKFCLSFW